MGEQIAKILKGGWEKKDIGKYKNEVCGQCKLHFCHSHLLYGNMAWCVNVSKKDMFENRILRN